MNSNQGGHDHDVVGTIVVRTADRLDVEPTELEPLAVTIDPELVAAFAAADATRRDSRLQFQYSGCNVRITGSGEVSVAQDSIPAEGE